MSTVWFTASVVEDIATAGSGALNAAYFARRAWRARGPRRFAAGLLATLFAASVLASLAPAGPDATSVLARTPLLAANIATLLVLWMGAGR